MIETKGGMGDGCVAPGENPHRRLLDDDLLGNSDFAKRRFVDLPRHRAAAADDRVTMKLPAVARNTMLFRISTAAIEGPIVAADTAADDSGRSFRRRTADGDVGVSSSEIANEAAFVDFDSNVRMEVVKLYQPLGQQNVREEVGSRHADSARRAAPNC